jgi:hypothetical protein
VQTTQVAGPIQYKRKYTLWVLIVLVILCWPAAILYYFTRDKVPVQELQSYATPMATPSYSAPYPTAAPAAPPPVAPAPNCPRCGRPTTWIAQYSRFYCTTDQQYV